jgi:luciferase family oxidoreductase group 1
LNRAGWDVHQNEQMNDTKLAKIPLSVLDLVPIQQGFTVSNALRNTLDLAQHTEGWGYKRYWLAEHHNIAGVGSSATAVLVGYVAGGTSTIRVGSGGVMLPNHAPLVIAEQFGTLAELFPGRIDLGLGRAPGTDQTTMRALRRDLRNADDFPSHVAELQTLLGDPRPDQVVHAVPGEGTKVPIWLLGSSGFSAQLAGIMGLPFAFAAHFQPENLMGALELYRNSFRPSQVLQRPHVMVGIQVVAADSEKQARRLATTPYMSFLNLIRNQPGPMLPPVDSVQGLANPFEDAAVQSRFARAVVGDSETVRQKLESLIDETHADEVMIVSGIYDHAERLRSYEIVSELSKAVSEREVGTARR